MTEQLICEMIRYYSNDPKRIQHFMKVHDFSRTIGILEGLNDKQLFILETAAIVHDIGIKASEEKYGNCMGKYQELEGPPIARLMLTKLGYEVDVIERVCFLVGHHHTYTNIDKADYQILVEADFIVNLYEDAASMDAILNAYQKIFRTNTGREILKTMFGI
ncbi:MAG: HD domain-containing protein [Thermoflexaceae bacterium]|nr:HD domain-containing protein [Thermoflexaceae bacterium]